MRVAVVTIVHGRAQHLDNQRAMIQQSTHPVQQHVVVVMDDPGLVEDLSPAPDLTIVEVPRSKLGLPLAAARNAGAAAALRAGCDLLVFLDVDCLPDPALVGRYAAAAADPAWAASLLCGPVAYLPEPGPDGYDQARLATWPAHSSRPAPSPGHCLPGSDPRLFWSLSFATTPTTWTTVGGFFEQYVGYGAEDTDFGFTAAAAGVPITWVGGANAYHQWHPTQSPPRQHLDDILRNAELFASRWGRWPMEGWLRAFADEGLIAWNPRSARYERVGAALD